MVRQILLAGLVVLLPAGLRAQGRGAVAPVSHVGAMAPRAVMPAPHAMPVRSMPGPRMVARGGTVRPRMGTPVARNTRGQVTTRRRFDRRFGNEDIDRRPGCNSAPGLGFDAVHQAAICGSGTGFVGRGFAGSSFFPFFDGGFFLPGSPATVEDSSTAEAAQPEATDADVRETRRRRAAQPVAEPPPTVETSNAAPADNEEFVFVRRNGTVFFAVGYTWENGTLRYVTDQGLRRTVTQDALDLDATRQFNEQRGLSFRLPS